MEAQMTSPNKKRYLETHTNPGRANMLATAATPKSLAASIIRFRTMAEGLSATDTVEMIDQFLAKEGLSGMEEAEMREWLTADETLLKKTRVLYSSIMCPPATQIAEIEA